MLPDEFAKSENGIDPGLQRDGLELGTQRTIPSRPDANDVCTPRACDAPPRSTAMTSRR